MTTPVYDRVAYLAADRLAVFNAASDSFVSEFAPGLRLRADCGTDGVLFGTVAAASFDAATGRTVVTTTMDGGAALTVNLASVLHGNDLPESLCAHAAHHAIGGRDALPAASTGVSGLASLATTAETQAGTNAAKAVTPAGLAASAKGLIATSTTIYVATSGSDTTGTGASGAPYASISKALSSIAGKLIASGTTVTIQVADGTYAINSPIVIDHPDADKIQILGNTAAETTVAISSIDTTDKTITMAGNYVSNADAAKNIQNGDIIGLTGSSTSGLNGAYVVSGVSYNGSNTVVICSAETIASATAGGGAVVIKPCNRCLLLFAAGVSGITVSSALKNISGFRIESPGTTAFSGLRVTDMAKASVGNIIACRFNYGAFVDGNSYAQFVGATIFKGCATGLYATIGGTVVIQGWAKVITDTLTIGIGAASASYVTASAATIIQRLCATPLSPAANTTGNANSFILS